MTSIAAALADALEDGGWRAKARPSQLPPPGDWNGWMILAGRGFGKTRAGTGWVAPDASPDERAEMTLAGIEQWQIDAIMVGIKNRECRYNYQSLTWAGNEVASVLGIELDEGKKQTPDKERVQAILDALITLGRLVKVSRTDPLKRKSFEHVEVVT
jgi:phage terminase large subunit-like protein